MKLKNAAKQAAVHNSIMNFSKGLSDYCWRTRGVSLSGGQKQRMSIARALVKQPEILLFDDSFSAVDTQTEEIILGNLKSMSFQSTTSWFVIGFLQQKMQITYWLWMKVVLSKMVLMRNWSIHPVIMQNYVKSNCKWGVINFLSLKNHNPKDYKKPSSYVPPI